jgi:hypothetical protein
MESISAEKTLAPSFARSAARGRPTTSDLCDILGDHSLDTDCARALPIDHGHCPPVCTIAICKDFVIHSNILEAFDDAEGSARDDGFDCSGWRDIVYYWLRDF